MAARSRRSSVAKLPEWSEEQKRQIAEKAYQYYLARGGEHGYELEDWLRAEAEMAAAAQAPKKPRRARTAKA